MNHSIRLAAAAIFLVAAATTASSQAWPMTYGVAVATKFSGASHGQEDPNGYVLTAYDMRAFAAQPVGQNWSPIPQYHHPSWTAANLGEIFGIALDCTGNIYVTATITYGGHNGQINYPWGTAGPGGVYKISGSTGAIVSTISLPNAGTYPAYPSSFNTPSLGNICFDADHNGGQLFVTNLDDGKIYRIDANLGAVLSTFDPFLPDGGTPGIAPLGERIWGIAYRKDSVYFAVWSNDVANPSGPQSSVWRVALDASGNFTGIAQWCFTLPSTAQKNPITDMEFNAAGSLLLIQSSKSAIPITILHLFPGFADMYRADFAGSWTVSTTDYEIGPGIYYQGSTPLSKRTSANGGCDWGFNGWNTSLNTPTGVDQIAWGGGDDVHNGTYTLHTDIISGWQGMSATSGGTVASSVLIDADNVVNDYFHSGRLTVGDIDVMRLVCPPGPLDCKGFSATVQVQPQDSTRPCCATFSFVNTTANTFSSLTATPLGTNLTFTSVSAAGGWSAAFAGTGVLYTPTTPYIPTGASTGLQACYMTAAPGPYFVELTISTKDGRTCKDTVQVDCKFSQVKPTPCIEILKPSISCVSESATTRTFQYCFTIQNLSATSQAFGVPITSVTVITTNSGTVSPTTLTFTPLVYGAVSGPLCVTISIPVSASLSQSCLSFAPHGPTAQGAGYLGACTNVATCIDLPRCASCCDDLRVGIKEPRTKQISTGIGVTSLFTVNPGPFRSVRATIERAFVSSTCAPLGRVNVPATFTGGSITGFPSPSFSPASTSAIFGDVPAGVPLANTAINLAVALPPPPSGLNCRDTVRICVRYEFTDTTCRTCDTTLCYTIIRKRMFIDASVLTATSVKGMSAKGGEAVESLEPTPSSMASATMASQTKATITIASRDALYRINRIRIAAEGGITITKAEGGTIRDNMATLPGVSAGVSTAIALDLVNDAKLDRVKFYVMLDVEDVETSDSSEADFIVVGSTAAGRKGDVVDADNITPTPTDVHTYALHFFAGNESKSTVHRVRITALDSARILAAGPFSSDRDVMFRPDGGDTATRLVPADVSDNAVVRSGAHIRPIYLTASGAGNGKLHLGFSTYDSVGTIIAEGDVIVNAPVTSIAQDDNGRPVYGMRVSSPVPNPAVTTTSFTLQTDAQLNMTLRIIDPAGKVIHAALPQTYASGDNVIIVDIASYPSGSYRIVMESKQGTISVPLIIAR